MARLFLAVPANALEKPLEPWMRKLKTGADKKHLEVRWTPPEFRHITVFFFGDIDEEREESIRQATERVTATAVPFSLKIGGMGAFPEPRAGRVFWLGVQNSKKLQALRDELSEPLRESGFALEEDYLPHLTIGRLRNPKSVSDFLSPFVHVKLDKLPVNELVLYESIQTGPFSIYKIRARFELRGTDSELSSSAD